jgi:hypothetical protein
MNPIAKSKVKIIRMDGRKKYSVFTVNPPENPAFENHIIFRLFGNEA